MAKSLLERMYRGEFVPHERVGMGDSELISMGSRVERLNHAFTDKLSDSLRAEFEALEKEKAGWASEKACLLMRRRRDSGAGCG